MQGRTTATLKIVRLPKYARCGMRANEMDDGLTELMELTDRSAQHLPFPFTLLKFLVPPPNNKYPPRSSHILGSFHILSITYQ